MAKEWNTWTKHTRRNLAPFVIAQWTLAGEHFDAVFAQLKARGHKTHFCSFKRPHDMWLIRVNDTFVEVFVRELNGRRSTRDGAQDDFETHAVASYEGDSFFRTVTWRRDGGRDPALLERAADAIADLAREVAQHATAKRTAQSGSSAIVQRLMDEFGHSVLDTPAHFTDSAERVVLKFRHGVSEEQARRIIRAAVAAGALPKRQRQRRPA